MYLSSGTVESLHGIRDALLEGAKSGDNRNRVAMMYILHSLPRPGPLRVPVGARQGNGLDPARSQ